MGFKSFRAVLLAMGLMPLALGLAAAAPAAAHVAAGDKRAETAAMLLDRLHVREIAETWRRMVVASLPERGRDDVARAKAQAAWRTAIERTFDPELFRAEMHRSLVDGFTAKELAQVLAFRESPLGKKLSLLEKPRSAEGQDLAATMAELGSVQKALRADPARRKVMEDIVAATGGVEAMVDMLSSISLGTTLGAAAAAPPGQPRMTRDEIMEIVEAARPIVRRAVGPVMVPATAVLYKPLSLRELKAYRNTLASPLGRKSHEVMLASLKRAMEAQAFAIGVRYAKELNSQDM